MKESPLAKVIALVNNKGGTGKTTLAVSTYIALEEMGFNCLFFHADSTGTKSAAKWRARRLAKGMPDVNWADLSDECVAALQKRFGLDSSASDLDDLLIPLSDHYDFVIVDTGGSINDEIQLAMLAADLVLGVFDSCDFSSDESETLDKVMRRVQKVRDNSVVSVSVMTKAPYNAKVTDHQDVIDALAETTHFKLVEPYITYAQPWVKVAKGWGITEIDAKKPIENMRALLCKMLDLLGMRGYTPKKIEFLVEKYLESMEG